MRYKSSQDAGLSRSQLHLQIGYIFLSLIRPKKLSNLATSESLERRSETIRVEYERALINQ
jgi:hypothetical protein